MSFLVHYGADSVTAPNPGIFGRALSLLDAPEPVNAKLANIAESFFHDVLRDGHSQEASRAARLPKPAMAVLAIFNILSMNPMVTTLDAVLEAFRPRRACADQFKAEFPECGKCGNFCRQN